MSRLYIAYRPTVPIPPVTYEPETEDLLNDLGVVNDGTLYMGPTAYAISGEELWTFVDELFVGMKNILGLALGSRTIKNHWKIWYLRLLDTATTHSRNGADITQFNGTFNGGFTHDGSGALGNGTNGYFDTNCVFGSANFSQNDVSFHVLSKTNLNALAGDFGALHGFGGQAAIYGRSSGSMITRLCESGVNTLTTVPDSLGLLSIVRESATTYKIYKDATLINTVTSNSTTLSGISEIAEFAINNNGSIIQYAAKKHTHFLGGKSVTASQLASIQTLINNFETNLNR